MNDTANIKKPLDGAPGFSVIMANFNNGDCIEGAIASMLRQTYTNWELLICDDASTDDSVARINKYLHDPRIKIIRNTTNRGIVHSENKLIRACDSEYIGILDSDDMLSKDALFYMWNAHMNNPYSPFIYSQYVFCDERLNIVSKGSSRPIAPDSSSLKDDNAVAFRTFKKKYAMKIGLLDPDMKYAEDKDFIYKMEEQGPIIFIDQELYYYRVQSESSSKGKNMSRARMAMSYARLKAYKRRINSHIPNLSKTDINAEVMYGLGASIKNLEIKKLWQFIYVIFQQKINILNNIDPMIKGLKGGGLWI